MVADPSTTVTRESGETMKVTRNKQPFKISASSLGVHFSDSLAELETCIDKASKTQRTVIDGASRLMLAL